MLKVSKGLVPFWKKRFETEGFSGLGDKAGRGLKPSLTEEQLSMLASSIDMGILMDDGYTRGFKTKRRGTIYPRRTWGKHLRHDIVGIS